MRKVFICTSLFFLFSISSCTLPTIPMPSQAAAAPACIGQDYTSISIITPQSPLLNGMQDRVISELERRTRMQLAFVEASGDYMQSVLILASTGKLPDIICMLPSEDVALTTQWLKNGWLKPYDKAMLEAAPVIVAEYDNEPYYQDLRWNGEIVFQPIWFRQGAYPNSGLLHVRQDILESLGLALPDTLDSLRGCMVTMKQERSMYGLVYTGMIPNMSAFAGAYGLPYNGWMQLDDGKYAYSNVQPQMLDALKYVRGLYELGLVDPDSSVIPMEIAEERYINGKVGFMIQNGGAHITRIAESIRAVDPAGKEWLLQPPMGPDGKRGYVSELGFAGMTAISSSTAHPVEAARLLNFLVDEEGQSLLCFGVEGIHYNRDSNGKITVNEEERKQEGMDHWDNNRYHVMAATLVSWVDVKNQDFWSFYGKDENYVRWYRQMYETNQGTYQVRNEVMLPTVAPWIDFNPTNTQLWEQYASQIILGKGDAAELFGSYVNEWYSSGGMEVEQAVNEMLNR